MTFPAPLQTVRLTLGPLLAADGKPLVGELLVLRSSETVRVVGSGRVVASQVVAYTDETGVAELDVLATDSAGIDRVDWTYRLTAPGFLPGTPIALPAAVAESRVEDLVPVVASSGATVWLPADLTAELAAVVAASARIAEDLEASRAARAGAAGSAAAAAGSARFASEALAEVRAWTPPAQPEATPGFLILGETDEVPAGTKPGTLIFRTLTPLPDPELVLHGDTATTFSVEGTAYRIARPAGLAVGDLLLVGLTHQSSTTTPEPFVPPAGFVRLSADSTGTTPHAYRPTALYALPIADEAALAAVPETLAFAMKAGFSTARAAAVAFRVSGADLANPAAGTTSFFTVGGSTSLPLDTLTADSPDAVHVVIFAMNNSAGVGNPTISVEGMDRIARAAMIPAAGSVTAVVVLAGDMTTTSRSVSASSPWSNAGAASVALRRAS